MNKEKIIIPNRVKELRLKYGETVTALASALTMSQSNLTKIENGALSLKYEDAEKVAERYHVSVTYVMGKSDEAIADINPSFAVIEIIDAAASCGKGIENFNPVVIGKQFITLASLKELTASAPENIKILRTRGDSMQPTINDGDIVWVDISVNSPMGDGLYLIRIRSDLFVKRIRFDFIHNTALILSDNANYPPIETNDPDNIKVIGKIISISKMLG